MTTYVTALSRSLTSYSYMIGALIQKIFSRATFYYTNHCGQPIGDGYRGRC